MLTPDRVPKERSRRWVVPFLVVIASLAILVVGVTGQDGLVRLVAAVVAVAAGGTSLVLARKKGNLAGWYLVAAGVALLRLLSES